MITTYLQGGLGNQMFQIATGYSHAKKNNDVAVFDLSNSHTPHQGENSSKYKDRLFNFTHMNNVYNICNKAFTQPGHAFCEIPYEPNQQLQGFFQSEKFFLEDKENIIKIFREGLKNGYGEKWIRVVNDLSILRKSVNKPIVSIHIRRGDYLKFPGIHDPCPITYYEKAMELMQKRIGSFHPYFVSDDIDWCKQNLGDVGEFSTHIDEIDDLMLLVNCDHNIIANSSFSWWGAYLNTYPHKIVVGPKDWFGPRGPLDTQDIIPSNWLKI